MDRSLRISPRGTVVAEEMGSQRMVRVLVVEDDEDIRDLISDILNNAGHDVILALDGQDGIDVAKEEQPDLILMDLNLPEVNGATASKVIKNGPETQDIPIIAMSAAHNIQSQLGNLAVDGFVAKPFDVEDLLSTIDAMVGAMP
jgi:CheY-like chemotaxis protein